MKNNLTKIASFILALTVLFSTFSFTVAKHYCGDFLVDVSFSGKTEGCGMQMSNADVVKMKKCCKDEVHKIDGQDELQHQKVEKVTFQNQQFISAFFIAYSNLYKDVDAIPIFYKDASPPDLLIDYQVLYQTFLI